MLESIKNSALKSLAVGLLLHTFHIYARACAIWGQSRECPPGGTAVLCFSWFRGYKVKLFLVYGLFVCLGAACYLFVYTHEDFQ